MFVRLIMSIYIGLALAGCETADGVVSGVQSVATGISADINKAKQSY